MDTEDAGQIDADATGPADLVAMCGAMPTTPEDWERCYLKRNCERVLNCESMNLFSSVPECVELLDAVSGGQLAFEARERSRAIAAGRASIAVDTFTQCLVDMDPKRCVDPAFSISCATRFSGTIPDNQGCYTDIECISPGAACSPEDCGDSCCLGTCTPRITEGEPCNTYFGCEPGFKCTVEGFCVSGDVGSLCNDNGDCDPDAWCDRVAGACKRDLPEGALCRDFAQCSGETACVGLTRTVEPPRCRRVNVEGDACDWFCLGNLYCDLSNSEGLGVCRSLPKHNESCGPFLPCIGKNEICHLGTCVTRPGKGQPCLDGACLRGLFCGDQLDLANPVCRALLEDGQDCQQSDQCQSHVCNENKDTSGQCQPWQNTCP